MASVPIPCPSSSTPGRLPGEGEGRLINMYVEKGGDTPYWRRLPGLDVFAALGASGLPRGVADIDGDLYAVYGTTLWKRAAGGSVNNLGTIPGADGLTLAFNNRVTGGVYTRDLAIVRETGAGVYRVDVSTGALAAYPDTDLPAGVNSVAFLGGYLLFTVPDGRMFASELNSTDINALSFATAESSSDGLVRGIVSGSKYYAMGTATIEPWLNVGNSPFPLARATTTLAVGLLTGMAVAGFGEGWDKNPFFVAHDGTVRELSGYQTRIVSTPDVEAFIARSSISTLEAGVYTFRGRSIWSLSSDQGTWELETATGFWHERASVGSPRWRASFSVKSAGKWVFGDRLSGDLLAISDTTRTEHGAALVGTIETAALKEYPSQFVDPDAFFYFTPSAGVTAQISWSIDGVTSWSTPLPRPLRPDDNAKLPVRLNTRITASFHGIRYRIVVADDADFSFMGAAVQDLQPRAA